MVRLRLLPTLLVAITFAATLPVRADQAPVSPAPAPGLCQAEAPALGALGALRAKGPASLPSAGDWIPQPSPRFCQCTSALQCTIRCPAGSHRICVSCLCDCS